MSTKHNQKQNIVSFKNQSLLTLSENCKNAIKGGEKALIIFVISNEE